MHAVTGQGNTLAGALSIAAGRRSELVVQYQQWRDREREVVKTPERGAASSVVPANPHYHIWRVHRSLAMDAPVPRLVHPPELGDVRKLPEVGGLHHHYERMAA